MDATYPKRSASNVQHRLAVTTPRVDFNNRTLREAVDYLSSLGFVIDRSAVSPNKLSVDFRGYQASPHIFNFLTPWLTAKLVSRDHSWSCAPVSVMKFDEGVITAKLLPLREWIEVEMGVSISFLGSESFLRGVVFGSQPHLEATDKYLKANNLRMTSPSEVLSLISSPRGT